MNYWPLLGVAVIVIGFALRFNPVPVVVSAALASGLLAGIHVPALLALLGKSFVSSRMLLIFVLWALPTAIAAFVIQSVRVWLYQRRLQQRAAHANDEAAH